MTKTQREWDEKFMKEFEGVFLDASGIANEYGGGWDEEDEEKYRQEFVDYFHQRDAAIRKETIKEVAGTVFNVLFERYLEYDDANRAVSDLKQQLEKEGE